MVTLYHFGDRQASPSQKEQSACLVAPAPDKPSDELTDERTRKHAYEAETQPKQGIPTPAAVVVNEERAVDCPCDESDE
jgi:hypothetical protein